VRLSAPWKEPDINQPPRNANERQRYRAIVSGRLRGNGKRFRPTGTHVGLRPDEVTTYGRRTYSAAVTRGLLNRQVVSDKLCSQGVDRMDDKKANADCD